MAQEIYGYGDFVQIEVERQPPAKFAEGGSDYTNCCITISTRSHLDQPFGLRAGTHIGFTLEEGKDSREVVANAAKPFQELVEWILEQGNEPEDSTRKREEPA